MSDQEDFHDEEDEAPEETSIVPSNFFDTTPIPTELTQAHTPKEINNQDLLILQKSLHNVDRAWAICTDVDDVCKIAITTVKLLEMRRKILGLDIVKTSGRFLEVL